MKLFLVAIFFVLLSQGKIEGSPICLHPGGLHSRQGQPPNGLSGKREPNPAQVQISLQISANCGGHCPPQQKQPQPRPKPTNLVQLAGHCTGHCTIQQAAQKPLQMQPKRHSVAYPYPYSKPVTVHMSQQAHLKPPHLHLKQHPVLHPGYSNGKPQLHLTPQPVLPLHPRPKPMAVHISGRCSGHCPNHKKRPKLQLQLKPHPQSHHHLHSKYGTALRLKPKTASHPRPQPKRVPLQISGRCTGHCPKALPIPQQPSRPLKVSSHPCSQKTPCPLRKSGEKSGCPNQKSGNPACSRQCPNPNGIQVVKQTIQQQIVHKETHVKSKVTHTIENI